MHEHVVCKSTIFFVRKDSWSHRGQAWVTAANSWGGIQITFCSFCNCLFILAQYQKILALILMLKLLSSRLQRGAAQKGFVQVALHVVGQTRKVSLSMGIPVDVIFVKHFPSNRQFFFNKIVAYEEWLNCMVTLRTSDLKNEKPWQWQRKL